MHDLEPRLARAFFEAGRYLHLDRRGAEHLVSQIALAQILRTLRRVGVGVDDAWQDHTAMQIDEASSGADECADRLVSANCNDGVAAQRDRLGDAALRVFGVNAAVKKREVGGPLGRGGHAGRQRSQCRRQPSQVPMQVHVLFTVCEMVWTYGSVRAASVPTPRSSAVGIENANVAPGLSRFGSAQRRP